jgi:hypothetical protein
MLNTHTLKPSSLLQPCHLCAVFTPVRTLAVEKLATVRVTLNSFVYRACNLILHSVDDAAYCTSALVTAAAAAITTSDVGSYTRGVAAAKIAM